MKTAAAFCLWLLTYTANTAVGETQYAIVSRQK